MEQFSKVVDVHNLRLMPKGLGVVWEWNWLESHSTDETSDDDDDKAGESTGTGSEFSEESDDVESMDTVTFKCIGASREVHSQEALASAKQKMDKGEAVTVRILPEPNNPYDSNAIAFQCKVDDNWVTIGYIVKEVLQHVHAAIQSKSIISVEFKWIKYIVMWSRSGPGFYAGINITRKGDWPREVRLSSSTQQTCLFVVMLNSEQLLYCDWLGLVGLMNQYIVTTINFNTYFTPS